MNYSNLINLRLVGLVTNFNLNPEKSIEKNDVYLSNFYKQLKFVKDLNSNSINLRFKTKMDGDEFRVHLLVNSNKNDVEELYGSVDVYKISENLKFMIKEEKIAKIFDNSKLFFENQFIELLNKGF